MYLNNKLVFLAGGTGLLGAGIIEDLLGASRTVRIRSTVHSRKPFIKHSRLEYVRCDLTSAEDCKKAVGGCDCAVMAAALTGGSQFSNNRARDIVNNNLLINIRILEALQRENIKRVVFMGSATLYQETSKRVAERDLNHTCHPHPLYYGFGWLMRYMEKLLEFSHRKFGMDVLIARAANIYGPYARFDPENSNFIPALIRKAADRTDPFQVWGLGDVVRDVVYSADAARAVRLMLNNESVCFDVFNIGSGAGIPVSEVVRCVLRSSKFRPRKVEYAPKGFETMKHITLDASKAKSVLGWEAKVSLDEGIHKTSDWWAKNKKRWKI